MPCKCNQDPFARSLATSCAYTDTYVQNPTADISSHSSHLCKTNGDAGSTTHTPTKKYRKKCVKNKGNVTLLLLFHVELEYMKIFFMVISVSLNLEGIWIQFTHAQRPVLHACTHTHTHPPLQMAGGILHAWLGLLAAAAVARRQQRGADIRKSKLTTGGLI